MSGIVGSRFNIRGSGLVGSLGTDGQVFTSSGAGKSAVYEASAGFDVTSITGATALAAEPDGADEIVLSDAGTLKRLDLKHLYNRPSFFVENTSSIVVANNTGVKITWDTELFDSDGTYDTSNNRFTPGVAGYYRIWANGQFPAGVALGESEWWCYINGSRYGLTYDLTKQVGNDTTDGSGSILQTWFDMTVYLDGDDYLEMYIAHWGGGNWTFNPNYNSHSGFRLTGV